MESRKVLAPDIPMKNIQVKAWPLPLKNERFKRYRVLYGIIHILNGSIEAASLLPYTLNIDILYMYMTHLERKFLI